MNDLLKSLVFKTKQKQLEQTIDKSGLRDSQTSVASYRNLFSLKQRISSQSRSARSFSGSKISRDELIEA
jgi:hypothetical protein